MKYKINQLLFDFRPDLKLDIARWDSCELPLRDGCVDVFITDLVSIKTTNIICVYTATIIF